ncbi:hypothetical protein Hanom_Chr11g01020031 [Helianthus anomalus]
MEDGIDDAHHSTNPGFVRFHQISIFASPSFFIFLRGLNFKEVFGLHFLKELEPVERHMSQS